MDVITYTRWGWSEWQMGINSQKAVLSHKILEIFQPVKQTCPKSLKATILFVPVVRFMDIHGHSDDNIIASFIHTDIINILEANFDEVL